MPTNQPQLLVSVNNAMVPGAVFLHVESLGYFAADRFRIGFAIGAGGFTTVDYFAALGKAVISIEVAAGGGFANLVTGQIDNIRIDLSAGLATLSGRDLSALLIDTEIAETFNNQTSSQIAALLATRHGLTANVTQTSTPVGQYYELDHTHTALGLNSRITTEWNLLTQLAHVEGFTAGVSGDTLNFGPPAVAPPVVMTPQTMMLLEFDLATTIPTGASVKSWNSRNKMAVSQAAGTTAGTAPTTTIIRPNLSASQAKLVADSHLAALARHTTILTATMPGDVTLTPGSRIVLSGTGAALDQSYTVDTIARFVGARRGFTQTVRAYAAAA